MKVLFVGGGRAAVKFLELFQTDSDLRIVGIVDPDPQAPGRLAADAAGIRASGDMTEMVVNSGAEIILELTGNTTVRSEVMRAMRPEQDLITAGGARVMFDLVHAEARKKHTNDLADRLAEVVRKITDANARTEQAADGVSRVLRAITMVTLNANVEAARAGESGRAFNVIVDRMRELVEEVRSAVEDMGSTSQQNRDLLVDLAAAEHELRTGAVESELAMATA